MHRQKGEAEQKKQARKGEIKMTMWCMAMVWSSSDGHERIYADHNRCVRICAETHVRTNT